MTAPTFVDSRVVHTDPLGALSALTDNLSLTRLGRRQPASIVPRVSVRDTAGQAVFDSNRQLVTWTSVQTDTDNMFSYSTPTQLTVTVAGSYTVDVEVPFTSSTFSTLMALWVLLNGSDVTVNAVAVDEATGFTGLSGRGPTLRAATVLPGLAVGSVITVKVYQNSGGALNTLNFAALTLNRIGP